MPLNGKFINHHIGYIPKELERVHSIYQYLDFRFFALVQDYKSRENLNNSRSGAAIRIRKFTLYQFWLE